MADQPMRVLGIAGSLRQGSYNRAALRAAAARAPEDMSIEIYEGLGAIPPYNEDVRQQGLPGPVEDLRERIRAADGVLFVTPEYNYSIPGVLKNAIDWASRPPDQPFEGKPVAVMGASPGVLGTARAQYHLRQSFVFLNAFAMPRPEVFIGQAAKKFDEAGELTDEGTARFISDFLQAFRTWIAFVRRGQAGG